MTTATKTPAHTRKTLDDRCKQEAWGNRIFTELTPTEGTAKELFEALMAKKKYCYPTYHLEGEVVVEEYYYSIGD